MLAVTDTGMGMDDETRRRVFEPFFTTKPVGQGTGLGLATVQGIVAQSGGHIEVSSEPGKGTTFKIYLPALDDAAVEAARPAGFQVPGGTETVLVVEDLAAVLEYVAVALRAYGYRVIPAGTSDEALRICERNHEPIHMVLTDVVMPKLSGPELVKQLAEHRPEMKVLFMSGYSENPAVLKSGEGQAIHFIAKPFSPQELAAKVREVLNPPSRAARILVADDEAGVRGFLRDVLEQGGYDVVEAENGKRALQAVRVGQVDLVITDLVMPEQEGIETMQALRKIAPGIPVIAISGAFGGQYLKHAVLSKPVSAEQLLDSVSTALTHH
jgi:DNA-binding NtrC family response regulator